MVYEEEQPYSLLLTCTLIYSCFYQPRFIKETEVGIGVVAVVDTAISIYFVGSKPEAYKTRPKGNMGS